MHLQELGDARPDVQDAVAKLCCTWWQYGAENREFLVSQTLPFLLVGTCVYSRTVAAAASSPSDVSLAHA
jgi:hypothetical protein